MGPDVTNASNSTKRATAFGSVAPRGYLFGVKNTAEAAGSVIVAL